MITDLLEFLVRLFQTRFARAFLVVSIIFAGIAVLVFPGALGIKMLKAQILGVGIAGLGAAALFSYRDL